MEGSPAGVIARNEFFGVPVVSDTVYVGAVGELVRYLGVRSEAELYLGAGNLWP